MKKQKHGNPRQHDNLFDSDLCSCGCASITKYISVQEFAESGDEDERETNARALAHARAVNYRAEVGAR